MKRLFSIIVAVGFGFANEASSVPMGTYILGNHPDGDKAPPLYGLRIDGLLGGTANYTFDVTKNANNPTGLTLDYAGSMIHIFGQVYGGEVSGMAYLNPELWTIDFTYQMVTQVPGDDDVWTLNLDTDVQSVPLFGMGSFTRTSNGDVYMLKDQSNGAYSFRFGDEDNDMGHGSFPGLSGWGWLDFKAPGDTDWRHIGHDDWIFTAQVAPVPDGAGFPESFLGLAALVGFGLLVRRRGGRTSWPLSQVNR